MDLTWYRLDHDHLLVGLGHQFLWRSHGQFTPAYGVGAIALAHNRLAFSFFAGKKSTLYVARFGAAEEGVASGETALGWTRTGSLVTLSDHGGVMRVRSASGRQQRTLARGTYNQVFDRRTGALFFLAHGTLERFDGRRLRALATLSRLGLKSRATLTPFPGVIALTDARRLVVLRPDGSLASSTLLPRRWKYADWAPGALAADTAGDVAFTATHGNTAYGSTGAETVYLLPAGARAARAIYHERVSFAVCERQAELAWHGRWLLYSASEGYAAVIDTASPGHFVDLSRLVHRLPGMTESDDDIFDAGWGGRGDV